MNTANHTYPPPERAAPVRGNQEKSEQQPVAARQRQQAKYLGIALVIATAANLPVNAVLAIREDAWQLWVLFVFGLILTGVLALNLRRRPYTGRNATGIIYGGMALMLVFSIFIAGAGLRLGMLAAVLGVVIATQLLATRAAHRVMVVGIISSFAAAAFDFFQPGFQLDQPNLALLPTAIGLVGLAYYLSLVIRTFPQQSVAAKTMLIFLVAGLLPLAIAAAAYSEKTQKSLTQIADEQLANAAEDTAGRIDAFFSDRLDEIQDLAQKSEIVRYLLQPVTDSLENPSRAAVETTLQELGSAENSLVISYGLLNLQGTNLVDSLADFHGRDESYSDYFRAPMFQDRSPFISPVKVFQSAPQVKAVLVISHTVRGASGRPLGVLRIKYDAHVLQRLVESANEAAGPRSYAVLFDEYHLQLANGIYPERFLTGISPLTPGQVFTLERSERIPDLPLTTVLGEFPELDAYLDTADLGEPEPLARTIQADSELQQVAIVSLEEKPWSIAFFRPHSAILAPLNDQYRDFLMIGIVSTNLIVLFGIAFVRQQTRPLARMTQLVDDVVAGNFDVQADLGPVEEIEAWGAAFNAMTAGLRHERRQYAEQVESHDHRLQSLAKISQHILGASDRKLLLDGVVQQLHAGQGLYCAQVFLYRRDKQTLDLAAASHNDGRNTLAQGLSIKGGEGMVASAALENRPIYAARLVHDSHGTEPQLLPAARAAVCVPISSAGQVWGVLDAQHKRQDGFQEQDITILQAVAGQLAISLENILLKENSAGQRLQERQTNKAPKK